MVSTAALHPLRQPEVHQHAPRPRPSYASSAAVWGRATRRAERVLLPRRLGMGTACGSVSVRVPASPPTGQQQETPAAASELPPSSVHGSAPGARAMQGVAQGELEIAAQLAAEEAQGTARAVDQEPGQATSAVARVLTSLPSSSAQSPVLVCRTITLAAEVDLESGLHALEREVAARAPELGVYASGVMRIEVPCRVAAARCDGCRARRAAARPWGLPRATSRRTCTFRAATRQRQTRQRPPRLRAVPRAGRLWPALVRRGSGRGKPGSGLCSEVMQQVQRFLSPSCPRVRVIGGTRFNPRQQPGPEWQAFGAYCFALPLVEYVEAADCCILACTLAWDAAAAGSGAGPGSGPGSATQGGDAAGVTEDGQATRTAAAVAAERAGGAAGHGCGSAWEAAHAAVDALRSIQPPALASAYAMHLSRVDPAQHTPDLRDWKTQMEDLIGTLEAAAAAAAAAEREDSSQQQGGASASDFGPLDRELAWQEYRSNGQQGLDDLLAMAANGGGPAAAATASACAVDAAAAAAADEAAEAAALGLGASLVPGPGGGGGFGDGDQGLFDGTECVVGGGGGRGGVAGAPELLMSKVVAARRSVMRTEGRLDPLYLLEAVQDRDPRAYQIYLGNVGGSASSFLASTPERLYVRSGANLASEAVAATRPRGAPGDVERDFWLSLDLLNSYKDHVEFTLVRDWIQASLQPLATSVRVEVPKSVLKQGAVQHLYGRLAAELRPDSNDAHVLQALHPTPAVCGRPREQALRYLEDAEPFDRGFYAGPFGWISGAGAEFVVAIRSALVQDASTADGDLAQGLQAQGSTGGNVAAAHSQVVSLYAGVGVVVGSDPSAEWQELELKVRQWQQLLLPPRLAMQQQAQQQQQQQQSKQQKSLAHAAAGRQQRRQQQQQQQSLPAAAAPLTARALAPGWRACPT